VLIVAIATPIDGELVGPIRAISDRIEVLYEPDLLPPTRYPGDHHGAARFSRDADAERRWQELLGRAEVLFGLPDDSPASLAALVRSNPGLRWVQGTALGTGEQLEAAGLTAEELERVAVTSASGVHVGPLAEFCLLGLLAFTKDLPRLRADQRAHHWDHYPVGELRGDRANPRTGRSAPRSPGWPRRLGCTRSASTAAASATPPHVDEADAPERLHELLARADAVVVTLPLTEETRGMLDGHALGHLKPDAILVNAGRRGVIDEPALITALGEHRLRGAALEVFATEPLPTDSPLWDLPNVLVSPHTAALSVHENERIDELFCENLRRYLAGEELLSRVDTKRFY
jgi:phosphoglycerate dehydrogenase-like enzyme